MAFLVKGTNIVGGKIEEGGASALVDLTDVQLTTPTDGQALVYDSELQKFINGDVADPQVFDTDNNGLAPASGDDDETKFLRNDGEWAEPVEKITPEYYYAHKEELEASGKTYMVSGTISGTMEAENVGYDNTTSGLTSTNLQDAVDELANGRTIYKHKRVNFSVPGMGSGFHGEIKKFTITDWGFTANDIVAVTVMADGWIIGNAEIYGGTLQISAYYGYSYSSQTKNFRVDILYKQNTTIA